MRRGEMSVLHEVPFAQYYGSVDSTPLFVLLAGGYFVRTGNLAFLKEIWSNVKRALQWMDDYGDGDGDGFVEYRQRSSKGLVQQGWKDSNDSVFHSDGRMAEPPIALCEVQAYVYAAKLSASLMARALQEGEFADKLQREAKTLRSKFEQSFWCEDLGMYALALDWRKETMPRAQLPMPATPLFCKIASPQRAARLVNEMMSEQLFSGWGIRTIGAWESRYNPMSYHNGSVWPHDNALIGLGFSLYGFQKQAAQIMHGLFEVSRNVEHKRMPRAVLRLPQASGHHQPDRVSRRVCAAGLGRGLGLLAAACLFGYERARRGAPDLLCESLTTGESQRTEDRKSEARRRFRGPPRPPL